MVEVVAKCVEALDLNNMVSLQWVKAHVDHDLNLEADSLVKFGVHIEVEDAPLAPKGLCKRIIYAIFTWNGATGGNKPPGYILG